MNITFELLIISLQIIHSNITVSNGNIFTISYIYAFNDATDRGVLWNTLRDIAASIEQPWLVCGDFNYILCFEERDGGILHSPSKFSNFKDCVMDTDLLELSSTSFFFTWSNL